MGIGVAALDGVEGADLNGVTGEDIGTVTADRKQRKMDGVGRGKKTEGRKGRRRYSSGCPGDVKFGMVGTVVLRILRAFTYLDYPQIR